MYSRLIINRYGANVSPCWTPTTMSKLSVSQSSEWTFTFVYLYSIIIAFKFVYLYSIIIAATVFLLCMELNALEKSTNNIVASRFLHVHLLEYEKQSKSVMSLVEFSKTISVIPKYFLYYIRFFAVDQQIIIDLWRLGYKGYTSVAPWLFRGLHSQGKGECIYLSIHLFCSGYIWHNNVGGVCRRISMSSSHLGVFDQALLLFYFKFFLSTESCSSCVVRCLVAIYQTLNSVCLCVCMCVNVSFLVCVCTCIYVYGQQLLVYLVYIEVIYI